MKRVIGVLSFVLFAISGFGVSYTPDQAASQIIKAITNRDASVFYKHLSKDSKTKFYTMARDFLVKAEQKETDEKKKKILKFFLGLSQDEYFNHAGKVLPDAMVTAYKNLRVVKNEVNGNRAEVFCCSSNECATSDHKVKFFFILEDGEWKQIF